MADDREPHVKCTEFISEHYDKKKMYINTEFETPEQFKYMTILQRLGDPEGFNIPAAEDKAQIIATDMISYKRQGRQENVVALVGTSQTPSNIMPVGNMPVMQTNQPMRPQDLQAAPEQQKKKHWWSRGR